MIRIAKIKLGKASKQEEKLTNALHLCCDLYNAALEQRISAYRKQSISLSFHDQCKDLTELRNSEESFKNLPVEMTRVTSLRRLDKSFKSFFRRVKAGQKPGFPRFKAKRRFRTLEFSLQNWKIQDKRLVIKLGKDTVRLRMKNQPHLKGTYKALKLIEKNGRWWAHVSVDTGPAPTKRPVQNKVGIDVGLTTFATLSDGNEVQNPRFVKKSQDHLATAQRNLSNTKKGSNRRKKALQRLNLLWTKAVNRRQDFIYKEVSKLTKQYDHISIEDLNIQGMLKGSKALNR